MEYQCAHCQEKIKAYVYDRGGHDWVKDGPFDFCSPSHNKKYNDAYDARVDPLGFYQSKDIENYD